MVTYIYDVVFGYITFLFFEEHLAAKFKEIADKTLESRNRCGTIRLFERFSHLPSRHPVCMQPTSS